MDVLLATMRFALKLQKTAPLGEVVREQLAPTADEIASDEKMKEYIKDNCVAVYHPVGTASMLPKEDGGVVDPTLKVYETANVRVVRPSVFTWFWMFTDGVVGRCVHSPAANRRTYASDSV